VEAEVSVPEDPLQAPSPTCHRATGAQGSHGPPRPEVRAALTEKPHNTSGECFSGIQAWLEACHHREALSCQTVSTYLLTPHTVTSELALRL